VKSCVLRGLVQAVQASRVAGSERCMAGLWRATAAGVSVQAMRMKRAHWSGRRRAKNSTSSEAAGVHVSRILAKLGVAGRGEAAAVAHGLGLDKHDQARSAPAEFQEEPRLNAEARFALSLLSCASSPPAMASHPQVHYTTTPLSTPQPPLRLQPP
jgi:hypothetical protein